MLRSLLLFLQMGVLLPVTALQPMVGVILWDWISFMNPHRLVSGPAEDLPWAMLVFAATAIGCVLRPNTWTIPFNRTIVLLSVFLLLISINTLVAMAPDAAVPKWESIAKGIVFLFIAAGLLTNARRVHAVIWIIAISLGYFGVKGGVFTIMTAGNYHVFGPDDTMIADNNHLAAALLICLPLLNYLRMQSRHRIVRSGIAAAIALTLLSVVGSYSRGALLGLCAVVPGIWLTGKRKVVTGIVLSATVAAALLFMPARWGTRMNTIQTYQDDASATTRLTMWDTAWKLALVHPFTGSGFMGPYTRSVVDTVAPGMPARAVHSIWFELIGEQGFPAFFVWLAMMLVGFFDCGRVIRLARDRPSLQWAGNLAQMIRISIVGYAVTGTFLSLSYWDVYFTILIVAASLRVQALALVAREEPRRRPSTSLDPSATSFANTWPMHGSLAHTPANRV